MKLACPKCDVRLRLPDTVASGRRITCPRCRCFFRLPGEEGEAEARSTAVDRPTSLRRPDADERRGSFRPRKRHKDRKSTNPLLIVIPVIAGVVVLVSSVGLAMI